MYVIKVALHYLIQIIIWAIIIKSLMSWFPGAMYSKAYEILDEFTSPIETPIRRIMGKYSSGPLDFSPMIAIFVLVIISNLIARFL
ncbi:YggT family protein [Peptostreptococcus equinus]|uniref:YggT family protein n=1 Tax=Peptostreptococcus equinus TaxID=3003601 RepID=A0ABY7JQI1_9FIRM|nr:YggT family protein [Peptostreptococcus sp. CBA3647]WAW15612.1 YggT family protein [Peptostreptococcus sp. CBA3647]